MSINRHNYEEYFILYMDNELGQEERRMVEAFVQQHPDLKEELDTLLQYKMTPDTNIVFAGKEELLIPIAIGKNGHSIISVSNYEEWLTLYIDNELTAEQITLVENYIAANPSVQKDLAFFQQSKLQPEEIVFAHKASLYKKEERVRRIIWWRAAAAVLLLAFGLTAVLITNKKTGSKDDVADTQPGKQEEPLKTNLPAPIEKNNTAIVAEERDMPVTTPVVADNNKAVPSSLNKTNEPALANNKNVVAPKNKLPENNPVLIKKEDEVVAENNKPTNNLPQPLNNPNLNIPKKDNAIANNKPEENKNLDPLTTQVVTNNTNSPSDYKQAANTNTEELEQSDGKKNKNRGIFRKIARTFEKRTNIDPTDDNKLLVAGLSIKLK